MSQTADFVQYIVDSVSNDGQIYRSQTRPCILNAARRKAKGTFEKQKAIVLFGYLAESGIRKFKKEFCHYYEIPVSAYSRVPAVVKERIAVRLLLDSMPEIDYEVREMKAAAGKKKAPSRRR